MTNSKLLGIKNCIADLGSTNATLSKSECLFLKNLGFTITPTFEVGYYKISL